MLQCVPLISQFCHLISNFYFWCSSWHPNICLLTSHFCLLISHCELWYPIIALLISHFCLLMSHFCLLLPHFCLLMSHCDECIGWCLLRCLLFVLDACPRLLRQLHRGGQCLCIIIRVIQIVIIVVFLLEWSSSIFESEPAAKLMLCKLPLRHIWISQTVGSWAPDLDTGPLLQAGTTCTSFLLRRTWSKNLWRIFVGKWCSRREVNHLNHDGRTNG